MSKELDDARKRHLKTLEQAAINLAERDVEPRVLTYEEMRQEIVDHAYHIMNYWITNEQPADLVDPHETPEMKIRRVAECTVRSIFQMLDGEQDLPPYLLIPNQSQEDREDALAQRLPIYPRAPKGAEEADIGVYLRYEWDKVSGRPYSGYRWQWVKDNDPSLFPLLNDANNAWWRTVDSRIPHHHNFPAHTAWMHAWLDTNDVPKIDRYQVLWHFKNRPDLLQCIELMTEHRPRWVEDFWGMVAVAMPTMFIRPSEFKEVEDYVERNTDAPARKFNKWFAERRISASGCK